MFGRFARRRSATASADASLGRLKLIAAVAAVAVAALLIAAKAAAWLATGSVSLLSTMIDSLIDLAASAINLVAIHHATQPADREHRFGHGKAEPLAGLVQAAFVAGSAAFLVFEAGGRLIRPTPISNSEIGLAVMALSIVLTVGLVLFQRYVVRRTGSLAISADALHYRSDLLTNLGVIVALVLVSELDWTAADPLVAIAVAAVIGHSAWQILRRSYDVLMDRELDEEERERIRQIAVGHPGVLAMHDLRTRSSGTHVFIQMHLEMDGGLTLRQAHAIADAVMARIEDAFPGAEVLIHEDPHGVPEKRATFDDGVELPSDQPVA
jgi:ferrous-iron efflux pump FieF